MKQNISKLKNLILSPQFIRFFTIGFGVFLIDFSLLNFLFYVVGLTQIVLGVFSIANVISTLIGLALTFSLNRYWTFGIRTRDRVLRQGSKFLFVSSIVWLIHNISFGFLVQLGIPTPIAKLLVMAVQMVVSYVLYKFVIFV